MELKEFEEFAFARPMLREDESFAERIIAIAQTRATPRKKASLLWELITETLQAFPFPKPGYALTTLALAGFLIGVATQVDASASDNPSDILYEAGDVL